jgi:lipopolysaccharide transport system ATP-binding protein
MLGAVRGLGRALGLGKSAPPELPTVFHVTHHKAGSQWINRILHALAYDRIVMPNRVNAQFLDDPIRPGKIYPTVYVTREQFESVTVPPGSRRFVVIRDLRDTLVSVYFSVKVSHKIESVWMREYRARLHSTSVGDGLMLLLDTWLPTIATIQWSWVASGEELIKYEELLERDEEILARVLLRHCRLPVAPDRFREVVLANRFETWTSGRRRGTEDLNSHERKGVAGDWKNHFTDEVAKAFKDRYGSLLVAAGYETGFGW